MTSSLSLLLVPLDGSKGAERALPIADQLAHRANASMLLMTSRFGPDDGTTIGYLTRTSSSLSPAPAIRIVEDRHAAGAILDVAEGSAGTLIVMAAHARGGIGQALLGSVTEEVIRHLEQPIVVVGPSTDTDWSIEGGHVVVCTDGSPYADSIVPAVSGLLHQLRLERVTVVRVGEDQQIEALASTAYLLTTDGFAVTSKVLTGDDPAEAIARHAHETGPALIVMATHGRTGMARVTLGSVTTGVTRTAPCPVLVARPPALPRALG